jgi:hypothetical protein
LEARFAVVLYEAAPELEEREAQLLRIASVFEEEGIISGEELDLAWSGSGQRYYI